MPKHQTKTVKEGGETETKREENGRNKKKIQKT